MAQLVQAVLYNMPNSSAAKTLFFPASRPPTVGNTLVFIALVDKNKTVTAPTNFTTLVNALGTQLTQYMGVKTVVSGDVTNYVTGGQGITIGLNSTTNSACRLICLEFSGQLSIGGYNHNYLDAPASPQIYSNKTGTLSNSNGIALVIASVDSTNAWRDGSNHQFDSGYAMPAALTTTGYTQSATGADGFAFMDLQDPYTNSGIPGYAIGFKNGGFDPTGEGATFNYTEGVTQEDQMGAMVLVINDAAVAPVISSPTPSGTIGTRTTATLGATTDTNSGTFYGVLSTTAAHIDNLLTTDGALVVAGQVAGGATAPLSISAAVSDTTPDLAVSALTAGTTYYYAVAQQSAAGISNVLKGSFTTAAAVRSVTLSGLGADVASVFTLLASKAVKVWVATGTNAAASDGGATGLDATITNGTLTLTNLTVPAGTVELRIKDPADALNSHIYSATAVEAS